jgi:hypothetical protein
MFSKQKLTEEEVRKTSRKYCCKDHCLLNLGTRGIRDAREKYFRLNSQDQSLSLQWLMAREEEGKEVPTRLIFRVQRQLVCRGAFKAVFCVGNNRITRIARLGNSSVAYPKPEGRPKDLRRLIVASWLDDFFKTRVESLPNKNVLHLPDNYTKFEVWKLFISQYGDRDEMSRIPYRHFTRLWGLHFPNVKIPPVSRFSACADCEEFKTMRDKAISATDRSKYYFLCYLTKIITVLYYFLENIS